MLATKQEAAELWRMSLDGATFKGAYSSKTKTAYVIAENISSASDLNKTLAHEIVGHGGLDTVIGKEAYAAFIKRIAATRNRKAFKQYWETIDRNYEGESDTVKAEEIFAYFVENEPMRGSLKYWWHTLQLWLRKQLARVGV